MTPGQKLKLGIFMLVSVLVTLLVLTTFGGLSLFDRDVPYFVEVPGGVGGLEKGSAVQLRGVRVGSITDFDLYPEHFEGVRVSLEVSPGTQIHEGAHASLTLQGLSGLKQLSIDPGPPAAPLLGPGATLPYAESSVQRITGNADELIDRTLHLLDELGASSRHLSAILAAVDPDQVTRLLAHAEQGTEQVASGARRTERELHAVLTAARRTLTQTGARTATLLEASEQTAIEARAAFDGVERLSRRLEQLVQTSDGQLRGASYDLRQASRSLEQFAQEIRLQPSRLLFSSPPPERELP